MVSTTSALNSTEFWNLLKKEMGFDNISSNIFNETIDDDFLNTNSFLNVSDRHNFEYRGE